MYKDTHKKVFNLKNYKTFKNKVNTCKLSEIIIPNYIFYLQLDLMIFEVFPNLNDSMNLW